MQQYMDEVQARHEAAERGELYASSPLEVWGEEARREAARDISVAGFLADFAKDRADRADAIMRWELGQRLPDIAPGMSELVQSRLPRFVSVNPEAAGGLAVDRARRFKIDLTVEDIINEAIVRLPRRMDAYRYRHGEAADAIDVPGLGEVKVEMSQHADVFTSVRAIEGDGWRVWNCRPSGIRYLDRYNDISRPSEISTDGGKQLIKLYDDNSGIYVRKEGRFSRAGREAARAVRFLAPLAILLRAKGKARCGRAT